MESNIFYTNERNVQIVIALLKAHDIHRVIVSPGTTNMTFVASIQNDPWFNILSSADERSAAYLACGIASETGEPVVISCTGATASRNYMPGLTEAYYRKLPILAITSTRGNHSLGHLIDQQNDRLNIPNDIAMESVTVPMVKDPDDERMCEIEVNKAILALKLNGGGPSHINLYTNYSKDFSVIELPNANAIYRHTIFDKLPVIEDGKRVVIFVGAHQRFTERQKKAIEKFCATYDSVVFIERTSGYNGKYAVCFNIIAQQVQYHSKLRDVDLLIQIGQVATGLLWFNIKDVWRINEDGCLRDTYGKLRRVFMMPEETFFEHYSIDGSNHTEYLLACKDEINRVQLECPELPFSNIWIAKQMSPKLPYNSVLHLGILNTLRSWSYVNIPDYVETKSNVGGYGIDGCVSTFIGSAICMPMKIHIGIFGDLAFFYDMNVLGNRHVGNNIRLLLINNGRGTEFRNYNHPCFFLGQYADEFLAAAGHYGNQSKRLVRDYAENLGFEYMSASSKEKFLMNIDRFTTEKSLDKPILFEVFTSQQDESNALELVQNIVKSDDLSQSHSIKQELKDTVKALVGENRIAGLKMLIKG